MLLWMTFPRNFFPFLFLLLFVSSTIVICLDVQELQECFEKKDIPLLQEVVAKMNKEEAEYHIKRCIDSGLWVPGGGKDNDDETESAEYAEPSSSSL